MNGIVRYGKKVRLLRAGKVWYVGAGSVYSRALADAPPTEMWVWMDLSYEQQEALDAFWKGVIQTSWRHGWKWLRILWKLRPLWSRSDAGLADAVTRAVGVRRDQMRKMRVRESYGGILILDTE